MPRSYKGHRPVRHGEGDWRCLCGASLKSWRWSEDGPDEGFRIPMTGRRGARDAMRYHRADMEMDEWAASPEGQRAMAELESSLALARDHGITQSHK